MKQKKPTYSKGLFSDSLSGDLLRRTKNTGLETVSLFFSIIILAVFPLMIPSNGYNNITVFKFNTFRVLTVSFMALCLLLSLRFLNRRYRNERAREGKAGITLPQIFLFAFMLLNFVSALCSESRADTWLGQNRYEGLCSVLLYGSIFLLLSFWGQFSDKWVTCVSIMAVIFAIPAVMQAFGSDIIFPDGYHYWDAQFLTTVGNIDCVSGIITMVLPILFCAFVLWEKKERYLCLAGIGLLFFVHAFTEVDSGKVGMGAALVFVLPFLLETREHTCRTMMASSVLLFSYSFYKMVNIQWNGGCRWNFGKSFLIPFVLGALLLAASILLPKMKFSLSLSEKQARTITIYALVALIILSLIFVFFYRGSIKLLSEMSDVLHFRLEDSAGSYRGYIWKTSVKLMLEKPLLGSGPGTFYHRFDPYILGYNYPGMAFTDQQRDILLGSKNLVHIDFAHNDFLQIGVCVGLVGFLLYLGFVISLAVRTFRVAGRSPEVVLLMAGVIGYLVYSFFAFSIAIVSPLFWVLAGLLDHCIRQVPPVEEQPAK